MIKASNTSTYLEYERAIVEGKYTPRYRHKLQKLAYQLTNSGTSVEKFYIASVPFKGCHSISVTGGTQQICEKAQKPFLKRLQELFRTLQRPNAIRIDHAVINAELALDPREVSKICKTIPLTKHANSSERKQIKMLVEQFTEDYAPNSTNMSPQREYLKRLGLESVWAPDPKMIQAGLQKFNTEVFTVLPLNWLNIPEQIIFLAASSNDIHTACQIIEIYGKDVSSSTIEPNSIYLKDKQTLLTALRNPNSNIDLRRIIGNPEFGVINQILINLIDEGRVHLQHTAILVENLAKVIENNSDSFMGKQKNDYYDTYLKNRFETLIPLPLFLLNLIENLNTDNKENKQSIIDEFIKVANESVEDNSESISKKFNDLATKYLPENQLSSLIDQYTKIREFTGKQLRNETTQDTPELNLADKEIKTLTDFIKRIKDIISQAKKSGYLLDTQVYIDNKGNLQAGLLKQIFTKPIAMNEEGRRTGFFEFIERECIDLTKLGFELTAKKEREHLIKQLCGLFGFGNFPYLMRGMADAQQGKSIEPLFQTPYWAQIDGKPILPDQSKLNPNDPKTIINHWHQLGKNSRFEDNSPYFKILKKFETMLIDPIQTLLDTSKLVLTPISLFNGNDQENSPYLQLPENGLIKFNRRPIPEGSTKALADGTPLTQSAISESVGKELGCKITNDGYTPTRGKPRLADKLKELMGLKKSDELTIHNGKVPPSLDENNYEKGRTTVTFESFNAFKVALDEKNLADIISTNKRIRININDIIGFDVTRSQYRIANNIDLGLSFIGPSARSAAQDAFLGALQGDNNGSWSTNKPTLTDDIKNKFQNYISNKTSHNAGIDVIPLTGGCSAVMHTAAQICKNESGTVLIPTPFFSPQEGQALSARVSVTTCPRTKYIKQLSKLKQGSSTVLTVPNNPDGYIWTESDIKEIVRIANKKDIRLVVDATYFNMVPETDQYKTTMDALRGANKHIIIYSTSKAFQLTGYRSAFVEADAETKEQLNHIHEDLFGKLDPFAIKALTATAEQFEDLDSINQSTMQNRKENIDHIESICNGTSAIEFKPDSYLDRFKNFVTESKNKGFKVSFDPGKGGPYGILSITKGKENGQYRIALIADPSNCIIAHPESAA